MGIWRELNTPDQFKGDWYGELTNQMAHTLLGVLATLLLLCAWREVSGEMPVRSWTFLAVFIPYAVGVEWLTQRWKPGDSWFDTLMFSAGAAGALLPFRESSVKDGVTLVAFDHRMMALIAAIWALVLWARVAKRYRDAK